MTSVLYPIFWTPPHVRHILSQDPLDKDVLSSLNFMKFLSVSVIKQELSHLGL
jgi:hypothetical protein